MYTNHLLVIVIILLAVTFWRPVNSAPGASQAAQDAKKFFVGVGNAFTETGKNIKNFFKDPKQGWKNFTYVFKRPKTAVSVILDSQGGECKKEPASCAGKIVGYLTMSAASFLGKIQFIDYLFCTKSRIYSWSCSWCRWCRNGSRGWCPISCHRCQFGKVRS